MLDCKECKERYRADHLIEENTDQNPDNMDNAKMDSVIAGIDCPKCKANN